MTLHHVTTDRFMYLCLCSVKYLYNIMFCLLQNKHTFISIVLPAQLNSINRNYRKFTCKSYFADILENLIKIKRQLSSKGLSVLYPQGVISYKELLTVISKLFPISRTYSYSLQTSYTTCIHGMAQSVRNIYKYILFHSHCFWHLCTCT